MQLGCNSKTFAGALSALALCISSTGAIAASPVPQTAVSPFVALSALGSGASASALCGSAAVAQGAGQGCILPGGTAAMAAAVVQSEPATTESYAPVGGASVSPLLLALAGVAAAVALYFLVFRGNDNFRIIFPQSPA